MGLKGWSFDVVLWYNQGCNRTIVGLKAPMQLGLTTKRKRCNRTIVGLKVVNCMGIAGWLSCCNRTIVGLKAVKRYHATAIANAGCNRTIVGLKVIDRDENYSFNVTLQSHHSGIERNRPTQILFLIAKLQSHHSGIERCLLPLQGSCRHAVAIAP